MPFSPQTLEEKPYNQCIKCDYIGEHCDGPNFLAMEPARLCEWCRLRKEYLHKQDTKWTNTYIAEQSKISKVTVDRLLSGHAEDIKFSTIAPVVRVLVNGTWGKYPCAMASQTEQEVVYVDSPALVEKCDRLQAKLAAVRNDSGQKIDFLRGEVSKRDKLIVALSVALGALIFYIII